MLSILWIQMGERVRWSEAATIYSWTWRGTGCGLPEFGRVKQGKDNSVLTFGLVVVGVRDTVRWSCQIPLCGTNSSSQFASRTLHVFISIKLKHGDLKCKDDKNVPELQNASLHDSQSFSARPVGHSDISFVNFVSFGSEIQNSVLPSHFFCIYREETSLGKV